MWEWNVSEVTDIGFLFNGACLFDKDISSLDVSHVTNMSRMLYKARYFREDLSSWDLSSVTDFTCMFEDAKKFKRSASKIGPWLHIARRFEALLLRSYEDHPEEN